MFYHIQIHHKHSADEYKINLTEEELIERIVKPYETGVPIVINGTTINLDLILRIKIYETEVEKTTTPNKMYKTWLGFSANL